MKGNKVLQLVLLIIGFCLIGCNSGNNSINRSFYYWKTTFNLSESDYSFFKNKNIHTIYVRMFDLRWDESLHKVIPIGEIVFENRPKTSIQFIPVVYITNRSLKESKFNDLQILAENIYNEVNYISKNAKFSFSELQLDCDWTVSTRKLYFELIDILKKKFDRHNVIISVTIRLHQVKYKESTGVPPVSKGMLMFYNMGKLSDKNCSNSIYNEHDALKYTSFIKNYPLHLDVALPLFSWGVHFRDSSFIELLDNWDERNFIKNENFTKNKNGEFVSQQSFFYKGFYFRKDDVIKIEKADVPICQKAAQLLSKQLRSEVRTITIFDFDKNKMNDYETKDFDKIYNCFN